MRIERVWAMPNPLTFNIKPIKELLAEEINQECYWVDPFARNSKLADITNDLNPNTSADYHMDATEFLNSLGENSVDGVLFDPPFSPRQIKEVYDNVGMPHDRIWTNSSFYSKAKNAAARVLRIGGKAICFGWNSGGLGKTRGFELTRILLVPHGGAHNDTICTVEVKRGL